MSRHRNALANETSPYLLQHADNPVDWYPWNDTALQRARDEQKPILLSIGYSACHWCHVMAHESFEDEDIAAIMNEHFINIKVDREERPDLDRIYQLAQQMLTQRGGGWPLTMFLTHDDHLPFFGGTYFPRESRYGLPGFREVLHRIAEFYRTEQDAIRRQNESLQEALVSMSNADQTGHAELHPEPLATATQQLEQNYDAGRGGFGGAPKFPHPGHIECLLRYEVRAPADTNAANMALNTLQKMAEGGIYDQLGGGFCRYSVDADWTIPHFEKMLYDNGPLLKLCAEAWQFSRAPLFRRVTEETAAWALREMRAPEGGFYSSLDADSEGEEGKYYVWTPDKVRAALTELPQAELIEQLIAKHYGLDLPPNFEGEYWHLRVLLPVSELAQAYGLDEAEARALIDSGRQRLFEVREHRVRPGRDDKLLTSWNALMIKGLAVAGRILERDDWLDAAQQALDCIRDRLWIEGRLRATFKDGRARFDAYLDDYAFLMDAILSLLETRWRRTDLDFGIELAEVLLDRFAAPDGGFYFTADDHEQLIQRSRTFMDESLPAGNGVAAFALQRLGHILGETRYLEAAGNTLRAAWGPLQRLPFAHGAMLPALEEYCYPPQLVVIRGHGDELDQWRRMAQAEYSPARLVLTIPAAETGLPGPLAGAATQTGPAAYICTGTECSPPITDLQRLRDTLSGQAL
jgi:uncharacterized protein